MAVLRIGRDDEPDAGRRRRRPVALELDGRAWLRVEPELLAELDVRDGDDLDDGRVTAIAEALAQARARLFVVRSLAARAQSVAEIERKLAARDIPDHVARDAIATAVGHGYLDDAELAGQLARGMRSRRYGARRAEQTLLARRIAVEEAQAALREAYGGEDEVGLARDALQRRAVTPDEPGKRRAVAFLVRRGFSTGSAWRAVKDELAAQTPE
jgi:regulatory protein